MSAPRTGPPLQIVRGEPSGAELAALIAVLSGLTRSLATPPPVVHHGWADPAHRLRAPLCPGPWRASLRDHR